MSDEIRVLFVGDIVGRPGRTVLKQRLPAIRSAHKIDLAVVNGENAAGGLGLDLTCAQEIFDSGTDIITLGDHAFQRKEVRQVFEKYAQRVVRPGNYPEGAPGPGYVTVKVNGISVAVVNMIGRVFMNSSLDCPFQWIEAQLKGPLKDSPIRLMDFHAEATSEKIAMGRYLDGRFSALVGTHTHVQTADEQILPNGLGYISDLGMTGSPHGVIGMDADVALKRFLTGLPHAYEAAAGVGRVCGVVVTIDSHTHRAVAIKRIVEDGVPA